MKIPYLIHVPKTGGRAVRDILGKLSINWRKTPGQMGHSVLEKSKVSYGFDYVNPAELPQSVYHTFSVVRNPYSLLLSHFNHRGIGWCNARERMGSCSVHGSRCLTGTQCPDWANVHTFDEFIKKYCAGSCSVHGSRCPKGTQCEHWAGHFWSPQLNDNLFFQLYDKHNNLIPRTILRQESLEKDLAAMLSRLGWLSGPLDLPKADPTEAFEGNQFHMPMPNTSNYRLSYTHELRYLVEKKCAKELKAFGYDFNGRI